jgi:hypothetical protein
MTSYRVYFTRITEIGITLDADNPEDAIEAAYDQIPALSAQDSGWGQTWFRDESSEPEPEVVTDEDQGGEEVWTSSERWTRVQTEVTR